MPKTHFAGLETPRLLLRRFRDADLQPFLAYRNDPEVARYQDWESISEGEARTLIEEQKMAEPGIPGEWFQIAIELKATGALVGDCAFKTQEHDERLGEIGYTLSRAYQGRGIASETVACLLDYVFRTLGMHRIIAVTNCKNAASIVLLDRLGFRREGHFLQHYWFKGNWTDEYLYAILKEEWLGKR